MLKVFPAVVAVKTSLSKAPRRTVATMVNPTREKMAPRASFLRKLMRTPQRIQTGNPMTGANCQCTSAGGRTVAGEGDSLSASVKMSRATDTLKYVKNVFSYPCV